MKSQSLHINVETDPEPIDKEQAFFVLSSTVTDLRDTNRDPALADSLALVLQLTESLQQISLNIVPSSSDMVTLRDQLSAARDQNAAMQAQVTALQAQLAATQQATAPGTSAGNAAAAAEANAAAALAATAAAAAATVCESTSHFAKHCPHKRCTAHAQYAG